MANYFNSLPFRLQVEELGKCEFMDSSEFADGVTKLKGKNCNCWLWRPGLAQGLNMRDSGLDVAYALRKVEIDENQISYQNAKNEKFTIGTIEEMVPKGDLVLNLTPDKYHTPVVNHIMPLMKKVHVFHIHTDLISSKKACKSARTLQ